MTYPDININLNTNYSNQKSIYDIMRSKKFRDKFPIIPYSKTVFVKFKDIIGTDLNSFVKLVSLKDKTLHIKCKNSVVKSEIFKRKYQIIKEFNYQLKKKNSTMKIKDMKFHDNRTVHDKITDSSSAW